MFLLIIIYRKPFFPSERHPKKQTVSYILVRLIFQILHKCPCVIFGLDLRCVHMECKANFLHVVKSMQTHK